MRLVKENLGDRARFILLCIIRMTIAPPGEPAGNMLAALHENFTNHF
jgi:hypothetical protein